MSFNSKHKGSEIEEMLDKVGNLAKVATSGSYDDLDNKPTIPSEVTESTVSGWGFTKNTGTYSKPSSGIPKSDLASAVRTSLGKADTAIQSLTGYATETYVKTKLNELVSALNGMDILTKAALSASNIYVNSTNLYVNLGGNVRTFTVLVSVPENSGITAFSIYAYDLNGKNNYVGGFVPGVPKSVTLSYDVNKIAVAGFTPDARYTGTFELEVSTPLNLPTF